MTHQRNNTRTGHQYPWLYSCDKPRCYYKVACKTEEEAMNQAHACPRTGESRIGWSIVAGLLQDILNDMDERYRKMLTLEGDDKTRAGYILRGMCTALVPFLTPHFRTADELVREIVRRVREDDNSTPGVTSFLPPPKQWPTAPDGGYTSDPAQAGPASSSRSSARPRATTAPRKTKREFTPDELATIKQYQTAGFGTDMIAVALKADEADIKAVTSA